MDTGTSAVAPQTSGEELKETSGGGPLRRLRVWPAAVLLAALWGMKLIPVVVPDAGPTLFPVFMFGPVLCAAAILVWWLVASRATWRERLIGFVGVLVVAAAALAIAHPSMRGFIVQLGYFIPAGATAFAAALVCLFAVRSTWRTWAAVGAAAIGFGMWDFVRYDGMWGNYRSVLNWRWEESPEERYLAGLANRTTGEAERPGSGAELGEAPWPGFRGPERDGQAPGVVLATDWDANPPQEVWSRRIGPGWSSFAVAGGVLFTQEQRGEKEAIVCLDAETGENVWVREYESRFFESIGGAGPRGTPTLSEGRLYAIGAEGILHCLEPATGEVVWRKDLRSEADREPPIWGFASSPLVTAGVVIVHAGGAGDRGVFAFDAASGEKKWSVPAGDHSYSSPHLVRLDGRELVLVVTNTGVTAADPASGEALGSHPMKLASYVVLQPLPLGEGEVVVGLGLVDGTKRLSLAMKDGKVQGEERWASKDLKPDFNDIVAQGGFLYGFDQEIFACVDAETGRRKWKRGRYGKGQVLSLPDAGQLVVLSEEGEAVLLKANPEKHEELARIKVLDGKTWNHPVLVGDRLYARNGEEAACFRMPVTGGEIASAGGVISDSR